MKRASLSILPIVIAISLMVLTGCEERGFRTADGNPATWDEYPVEYLEKNVDVEIGPGFTNTRSRLKSRPDGAAAPDARREDDDGVGPTVDVSDVGLNEAYLIIANDKYRSGAERLRNLRTEQFDVGLEYVSSSTSAEDVRDIIEENIDGFAYVVLIGSCEDVACYTKTRTYKVYVNGSKDPVEKSEKYFTDNYYADFDNDLIPEITIGRLPVTSGGELDDVLDKIESYEHDEQHRNNHYVFAAGSEMSPEEREDNPGNIWHTGSYFDEKVIPKLVDGTDVSKIYCYCKNKSTECKTNTELLIDEINRGAKIVTYVGHSGPDYLVNQCCNGSFGVENVQSDLNNSEQFPIFISLSCGPTDLLYDKKTIAESLLMERDAGSIAFMGPSGIGGSTIDDDGASVGMFIISDEFFRALGRGDIETLGQAFWRSKQMQDKSAYEQYDKFQLFGDPGLKIK